MTEEIYEPWFCEKLSKPIRVSMKSFIYHSNSTLDIQVYNVNNHNDKFTISFSELPIAMRVTNESQRIVTLNEMQGDLHHFINLVQNSKFLSWLNHDSLEIYKNVPWKHFTILVDDEWIDIITSDFPQIVLSEMQ